MPPPRSGTRCSVRGCTNTQAELNAWLRERCVEHAPRTKRDCPCERRFRFHRLPRDAEAKGAWLRNLDLPEPPKNLRVCSAHFVDRRPTEENPHPTLRLGCDRAPEEETGGASTEAAMSVSVAPQGEEGGGAAAHLQCPSCGHLSRSHAQQLFHVAASHPAGLNGAAVGRLGNIVMYQSGAQLFHCFDCFFTSRDFTKLYKHIISKHCMDGRDGGGGGGGDDGSEKGEEKTREEGEEKKREEGEEKTREEGGEKTREEGGEKTREEGEEKAREEGEEKTREEGVEEAVGQVTLNEEEGELREEDGASQRAESAQANDQSDGNGLVVESGSYRCLICGWKGKVKSQGVGHVMRKHGIPKTYAAQAIRRCAGTPRQAQGGGPEDEEETGLSGETLKEELEATAKVIDFVSNRFVCLICGWKTKLKGFAISHVVASHNVERPYTCKVCQRSFFLPSRLQQHVTTAHRPGRYTCPFCCFRSQFLGGFRRHCSRCNAREGRGEEGVVEEEVVEEEEDKSVARKRRRTVKEDGEEREEDDDE